MKIQEIDWLLDKDRGYVLYFRPRCGSTTLTRWFFENQGVKFGGFSIAAFRNEWLEPRLSELTEFLRDHHESLHKFVVIRDPIDRAVSSYLHVVNNPADSQWVVVKPLLGLEIEKHDLTFRQFVTCLQRDDLDTCNIIWRHQSALSCWERGVDDIVLLEDLNEYLLKMNKRFKMDSTPTWNSVTVKDEVKDLEIEQSFADVPFRELLQFKEKKIFTKFPTYERFYDAELLETVEALYSEDLSLHRKIKAD